MQITNIPIKKDYPANIDDFVYGAIATTKYIKAINEIEHIKKELPKIYKEINSIDIEIMDLNSYPKDITEKIIKEKKKILCLKTTSLKEYHTAFMCKTNSNNYDLSLEALQFARDHTYLAIPATQPYLFLSKNMRKNILTNLAGYHSILSTLTKQLTNTYIHNRLIITEILHAFKQAVNNDFKTAINQNSLEYGTHLKELIEDFHNFLGNDKYIFPL